MIEFHFQGGPKDGETVGGPGHDESFSRAMAYAAVTDGGSPGCILWCTTEYFVDLVEHLSDSALQDLRDAGVPVRGHLYEVYRRSRAGRRVRVFLRHLGACPSRAETFRPAQRPPNPSSNEPSPSLVDRSADNEPTVP